MAKIDKEHLRSLKKTRTRQKYLCNAPFNSVKVSMDGRVSPCCYNEDMYNLYPLHSLKEIWNGSVFGSYRTSIKKNILPSGCRTCENAILNKEYHSVKIHQYDDIGVKGKMPRIIELALDNTCNLECIMCNGHHSSSIRKNIEKLPNKISFFDDNFRKELIDFIPYLEQVVFAGGEPFLIPIYYDIWEDIIRINPKCEISVVTNGTVLNDKIKKILERGNFHLNLSFDAVKKITYESIRVNAVYENVLENMQYFGEYLKNKGRRLHLPICPLKINRFELPDLVRFCNKKRYSLNFVHVNGAFNTALWSLSSKELISLKNFYLQQDFYPEDDFDSNNIKEFDDLVIRLDKWIENAKIKEQFENTFDLLKDQVEDLEIHFLKRINAFLRDTYNEGDVYLDKKNQFLIRYNLLMSKLPTHFKCNHFYRQIKGLSNSVVVVGVLEHHIDIMVEKCYELFYYGQNH